jgi:hypothetical protein
MASRTSSQKEQKRNANEGTKEDTAAPALRSPEVRGILFQSETGPHCDRQPAQRRGGRASQTIGQKGMKHSVNEDAKVITAALALRSPEERFINFQTETGPRGDRPPAQRRVGVASRNSGQKGQKSNEVDGAMVCTDALAPRAPEERFKNFQTESVPLALRLDNPGVWVTATPIRAGRRAAPRRSWPEVPPNEEEAIRRGWPGRGWRSGPLSPASELLAALFTPERSPCVAAGCRRASAGVSVASSSSGSLGAAVASTARSSPDDEDDDRRGNRCIHAELALLTLRAYLTMAEETSKRRRLARA